MPIIPRSYEARTWTIVPRALALNEPPPPTISEQQWILTMTGVAIIDFRGNSSNWRWDTADLSLDYGSASQYVIGKYGIPTPPGNPGSGWYIGYQVDRANVFVSLNSVFDQAEAINAGFAIDRWRLDTIDFRDAFTGQVSSGIVRGVLVDVAVRDSDAWLYRIGYQVTLVGRPRFTRFT